MEIRHEIKKKPLSQSQKSNKLIFFAILILVAISALLLINRVLYYRSIYTYDHQKTDNKDNRIKEARSTFEMSYSPLP